MMPNDPSSDPARSRYLIIQLARLSGVVLTVLGVAIIAGRLPLPELAGYVLVVAGVTDALVVPPVLARMWRTPL